MVARCFRLMLLLSLLLITINQVWAAPPLINPFKGLFPGTAKKKPVSDDSKTDDKTPDGSEVIEPTTPVVEIGPREIRLHLMDRSVIAGELTVNEITVKTKFGDLVVPVEQILSFRPGLNSYPEVSQQINQWIEDLASDDYQTRERSHKELVQHGLKIRLLLEPFRNDKNAERKRHIGEIFKAFDELLEEQEETEEGSAKETTQPWVREDTIVTKQFTIVGKIKQASFNVSSKYGPLSVKLSDVQRAVRGRFKKEEIRKSFAVTGMNLVQKVFKSSGVRVERGDKITVRASGQIVMSPWGGNATSSPDGGTNYGWYVPNKINGGALVAKIGNNGAVIKIGSRKTFVATKSGVLQFAVAMQSQYAGEGYNFPGQYQVKMTVHQE